MDRNPTIPMQSPSSKNVYRSQIANGGFNTYVHSLEFYMPASFQILIKTPHCSPHLAQTFMLKVMADNLWIKIVALDKDIHGSNRDILSG